MMFTYETFRGRNGKAKNQRLYYELCYSDTADAIFTLKERDIEEKGKLVLSLKKLYVARVTEDPTEYEFYKKGFNS